MKPHQDLLFHFKIFWLVKILFILGFCILSSFPRSYPTSPPLTSQITHTQPPCRRPWPLTAIILIKFAPTFALHWLWVISVGDCAQTWHPVLACLRHVCLGGTSLQCFQRSHCIWCGPLPSCSRRPPPPARQPTPVVNPGSCFQWNLPSSVGPVLIMRLLPWR